MLRRKALIKDIFREIWHTRNRFLSIFAIIALGVGFFTGIKATCPDMKATASAYYRDQNLMDFKLLSTLGFDQEDVTAAEALEIVDTVMPSYSADVIVSKGKEDEATVKVLSYQQNSINNPLLLEGRFPEKSGECVVEVGNHSPDCFALGQTVELSSGTQEEALSDTLKTDQFVVVGIVQSPLYVNFERGSTSLGNGSLDSYMMVLAEDFSLDVYTELYLTLQGSDLLNPFEDEYSDWIDSQTERLENFAVERAELRYQKIYEDAQAELEDARTELADGRNTQQTQLAQAQQELEDARIELEHAQTELNRQKQNYETTIQNANQQIADGFSQLDQAQTELNQKKTEYDTQITAAQQQLTASKQQLTDAQTQLDLQKQQLQGLPAEHPAVQQLVAAQTELDQNLAVWEQQYQDFVTQKDSGTAQLSDGQAEIDRNRADLAEKQTELQRQQAETPVQFADAQKQIDDGWVEYQEGISTFEQEKADSDRKLADAETEIADAQAELDELSSPKGYAFDRTSNPGYAEYGTDAERVDNVAKVFPLFFILVAMLVCLTTMTRMVEEHRTQIGTLKALGYSKAAIIAKYLIYAISASFLGSIAGVLLCSKLFPLVIFEAYRIMYIMPDLIAPIRWDYAFFSTLIAVACTSLAAFLSCYAELFAQPAQLMRPKSPKAGKRVFLEKIPFLWNRLSFIYKVTVRNIFRYKKRVFMTVVGIAGCTALMLAGFGMQYAIASIVPKQFENIFLYDVMVMVQDDLTTEQKQALSDNLDQSNYLSANMYIVQKTLDVSANGVTKSANLFVPSDPDKIDQYISLQQRKSGKKLTLNDEGVILNEKLAKLLDLKVGDSLDLTDENGGLISATISGITENYTMNFIYLTPAYYENLFGFAPDYNCIVVNIDDALNKEEIKEDLSVELVNNPDILGLSFSDDSSNSFQDIVSSLNYIVLLIIICAGALAFVVLYNLVNVNVAERTRELATIKVLGFYDQEVSSYVYRENIFCTLLGIISGLILGVYLERFVVRTAEVDMVMFTPEINLMSYLYSAALTILFTLIVNVVLHFKLKKLDMVESMKSIE